ncbi:MAG TPA: class IV adenylate cyclase [Patescibacteria group bacterium]|nr:class IV adenylate cyclase [Patescibacteria group bacterium]
MTNAPQEVELKLPISNKEEIIKKLENLGAVYISKFKQSDYLFNSDGFFDFAIKDEALRLRLEKSEDEEKVHLTYKGPPSFSAEGHKIRDEYEVVVSDFETTKNILLAIRFKDTALVEKVRTTYHLNDIIVAIDELKFGLFIELEGDAKKSEELRKQLGLGSVTPIKKGYIFLQRDWEATQK